MGMTSRLILRRNGSLHSFLVPLFCTSQHEIRWIFRRVFLKKNGNPRRPFAVWVNELNARKKAATFDPQSGFIDFYPDLRTMPRLNVVLYGVGGWQNAPSCDLPTLMRFAVNAKMALRLFRMEDNISLETLYSTRRDLGLPSLRIEIVTLSARRKTDVGIGPADCFVDWQRKTWETYANGEFRAERFANVLDADRVSSRGRSCPF